MKRIVLCADDYAQNSAISAGILALIASGRLSAVSCMTTFPDWAQQAKDLRPHAKQVDIGLHFNLTEGYSGASPLNALIIKSHLGQIDAKKIEAELNRQLDRFYDEMGQSPDFIDGHQHVHHLPGVRQVLLKVLSQRFQHPFPYIRVASNGFWSAISDSIAFPKPAIITLTGALALRKALVKAQILHNTSFAGIYSFAKSDHYPQLFPQFLSRVSDNGLIMCHPGFKSQDSRDSIASSRFLEYQYFKSEQFIQDCSEQHVVISRFGEGRLK